ncbi:type VII secretion target [Nocardia sp. NPDC058640]|uniref:type VII secretion target n=1 Tax=Nocardia sp. NPDC058640 TaxID=3346571 RepID=UPI00364DE37D
MSTDELEVDPSQLEEFASKLRTLATDHEQATPYAQQWLNIDESAGGAFLPSVSGTVQQLLQDLKANFATLGTVTSTAASELDKSATMYRTTDYATAAALDKTYGGSEK